MRRSSKSGAVAAVALMLAPMLAMGAPTVAGAQTGARPAPSPAVVAAYERLMQLNGVTLGIRVASANTATAIRTDLVNNRLKRPLTAAETTKLDALIVRELDPVENQIIDLVAASQAGGFSEAEIGRLVQSQSIPAMPDYIKAKFMAEPSETEAIQALMVNAVIRIIKTYQESTRSALEPEATTCAVADPTGRIKLARAVMKADGTQALVEVFVAKEHMRLIIGEVANHIPFDKLSENDKVRLAAIASTAQAELVEGILQLQAERFARLLSSDQLTALAKAFDTPEERKLTQLRANDDGAADAKAAVLFQGASDRILSAFLKP